MSGGIGRRVWAAAAAAGLIAAVVVVVALAVGRGSGGPVGSGRPASGVPGPGGSGQLPPHFDVVDGPAAGQAFPGGLMRFGQQGGGGAWLLVYQRFESRVATVFAREGSDLLGPLGKETMVSDPSVPSYDPGVVQLDDGTIIVTWEAQRGFWYSVRGTDGSYSAPKVLFSEPSGGAFEQTVTRLNGHAYILYNFHPFSRQAFLWDIRIRRILDGVRVGPPATVVENGPGFGRQGAQKRATAAETGSAQGVIVVWNDHTEPPCVAQGAPQARTACGARPIRAAISSDAGQTWGQTFQIASLPGHDLVNPFVLRLGGERLRVYFTVDAHVPEAAYVESGDGGRTWSSIRDVWFPREISPARMIVQDTAEHGLVAVVPTRGFLVLGTFPLADATRENALTG